MSKQVNRIDSGGKHRLAGSEIDRGKPVRFRLDGKLVHGFAGDTVLSAALASGVMSAGWHSGAELALDERFAPQVLPRARRRDQLDALPMERLPAIEGLDLVTVGQRRSEALHRRLTGRLASWGGLRNGLGLVFDGAKALGGPWVDRAPSEMLAADLVVVGGGIAGLSAAAAAGQRGDRVVLVERRPAPGGDVRYFGSVDGEEAPELIVAGLLARVAALPTVAILLRSEAFAVFDRVVRVHSVDTAGTELRGRVLEITSPRIVLATGTLERLPVFAGNRLPGVTGALSAFTLADRYGVWPGRSTLISTAASEAYRLAMLAQDAGIRVLRVSDARLGPQSRFIEFSKAYGIALARGLIPAEVTASAGRESGMQVVFAPTLDETTPPPAPIHADRLIVCGGYQPDLTLWHMAGGGSRWEPQSAQLLAEGEVEGVLLAGSAAGYHTNKACMRSAQAAVARMFGRTPPRVEDVEIDPIYETAPSPCPVSAWRSETPNPTYLDGGASLTLRTPPVGSPRLRLWPFKRRRRWPLADQARALSIGDVAAGVQIGAIPPADAGVVAQERSVLAGDLVDAGRQRAILDADPPQLMGVPRFLAGRFDAEQIVRLVAADDGRRLDPGTLIYGTSNRAEPLEAIGVVLGTPKGGGSAGTRAVLGATRIPTGERVWIKDVSQLVPARLLPDPRPPT